MVTKKDKEEFILERQRHEIFEEELLGKILSAGRIYRKIRAGDKEFIRLIIQDAEQCQPDLECRMVSIENLKKIIKNRAGDGIN